MTHYYLFTITALIAVAIPGPDFVLVFQTALRRGKHAGVMSAAGIAAGLVVHGVAATVGLSALLLKSARAFEVVKWAGALYLVYLAFQLVRDLLTRKELPVEENEVDTKYGSAMHYFLRGFLTNVLNVKAALYFVAIVPQFVRGDNHVALQLASLSMIQIVVAFVWFSTLALAVNKLGVFLRRRVVQKWLDGATAAIFLGLAAKLVSTHRA